MTKSLRHRNVLVTGRGSGIARAVAEAAGAAGEKSSRARAPRSTRLSSPVGRQTLCPYKGSAAAATSVRRARPRGPTRDASRDVDRIFGASSPRP